MSEKIAIAGSFLLLVGAVLSIVAGSFLQATILALISMWGIRSKGKTSAFDEVITSNLPPLSKEELKNFRSKHPDLSFSEAVLSLRTKNKETEGDHQQ